MTFYAVLALGLIALILASFPVGFAAGIASMLGAVWFFGDPLAPRVASMLALPGQDRQLPSARHPVLPARRS